MKKQFIVLSLGLITIGAMAQKKELKIAEKALNKQNFSGAITALASVENLITNADAKYKAKYYFLKGQAFMKKKDYITAAKALNNLMTFEKKIDRERYTEKATPMLNKMIQEISQRAIKLYNSKDYKNAVNDFYTTYVLSPKDTSFLFNAAVSAYISKDYDTSLKYYRELKNVGYTGIITQYLATNKKTSKVENLGSKTQRDLVIKTGKYLKPENKVSESKRASIIKNIAYILKEQGKVDEAILAVQEARKSSPEDLNLILTEADLYVKLKRMGKFGELMKEAVKMDPNNPTLYFNLGVVNFNQKRIEDAKKYYKKAIELKPSYVDAYMNLAVAILDKDRAIIDEINKNLSDDKKYNELEKQQKEVYKEALPYLEKADALRRNIDTVKTLLNIYGNLEMKDKVQEFKDLYKSMK